MAQECEENFKKSKVELHLTNKACEDIEDKLGWKSNHYIQEFQ
jgi:hypothetical protein